MTLKHKKKAYQQNDGIINEIAIKNGKKINYKNLKG